MLIRSGGLFSKEAILVCVISIVVLIQLAKLYPNEITGERFFAHSSESMVQTIPANVLRDKPFQAIICQSIVISVHSVPIVGSIVGVNHFSKHKQQSISIRKLMRERHGSF